MSLSFDEKGHGHQYRPPTNLESYSTNAFPQVITHHPTIIPTIIHNALHNLDNKNSESEAIRPFGFPTKSFSSRITVEEINKAVFSDGSDVDGRNDNKITTSDVPSALNSTKSDFVDERTCGNGTPGNRMGLSHTHEALYDAR